LEDDRNDGLPKLGSLAQKAREKSLNTARIILILVGILQIGVGIGFAMMAQQNLEAEVKKQGMVIVDQRAFESTVHLLQAINGAAAFVGLLLLMCGLLVKRYPVPMTVTGLVLYVGLHATLAILEPESLVRGILLKIIFVVALVKAIQAAAAYQREEAEQYGLADAGRENVME
jgi:hypothetical protein